MKSLAGCILIGAGTLLMVVWGTYNHFHKYGESFPFPLLSTWIRITVNCFAGEIIIEWNPSERGWDRFWAWFMTNRCSAMGFIQLLWKRTRRGEYGFWCNMSFLIDENINQSMDHLWYSLQCMPAVCPQACNQSVGDRWRDTRESLSISKVLEKVDYQLDNMGRWHHEQKTNLNRHRSPRPGRRDHLRQEGRVWWDL